MTINYGLLDTTLPEKLGAMPGNALAKYAQTRMQMDDRALEREHAGTRNALATMQLDQGRRAMDEEDAYRKALAGVQGGDYTAAMPDLMKASPARALALKKSLSEEQKSGVEAALNRFKLIDHVAGQFAANPTRQTGVWVLSQLAANGTPQPVIQEMSAKLNAASDADLPKMAQAFLAATTEGIKAQADRLFPKPGTPSTLARLFAERDALPAGDPRIAKFNAAIEMETTRKDPAPYFSPVPTGSGYYTFDARTGTYAPARIGGPGSPPLPPPSAATPSALVPGAPAGPAAATPPAPAPAAAQAPAAPSAPPVRPPLPAAVDPDLQRRLAAAKAAGTAEGERTAAAQGDLPRATAQADELLRLTEELLKHPGLDTAVGKSSMLQVQRIPGTDARDFAIRLDQIKGKQFLEAFQSLKGSGAITETEGRKATEAIARMDPSSSEPEFRQAVRDFQDVVRAGLERTQARAGRDGGASAPGAGATPSTQPAGMDSMPPPSEHVGRTIRDSATGVRYRSDGRSWVRVQ
jgi:hypothetical protein